ncbi:MAG: hypothetical protein SF052_15745 [Bacteroidia bacterium]|nr:hypothetical protein [Bacteroidia bacterium]
MKILIYPAELSRFPDYEHYHITTVRRKYNQILDFVGKRKPQRLTIDDLVEYFQLPESRIRELIKAN